MANKRNLSRTTSAKAVSLFVTLIVLVLAAPLAALESATNAETNRNAKTAQVPPREGVVSQRDETKPRIHRFFDRNNLIGFTAMFAGRSFDLHSTCRALKRGRREVVIPSQSCKVIGTILYSASVGTVGLSYWFHRKDHHKLERWLPRITAISGGIAATWNYSIP